MYFGDQAPARWDEGELQRQLTRKMPGPCWEVTNQATVHHWFLDDLFSLRVRHNPVRASAETYRKRVEQERFSQR